MPEILTLRMATSSGSNAKRHFFIRINEVPQMIDKNIRIAQYLSSDDSDIYVSNYSNFNLQQQNYLQLSKL